VSPDEALAQVGSWLRRRLHDATVDFRPPREAVWFAGQRWRPGLIIGHLSAAPGSPRTPRTLVTAMGFA
jgi:hypothetical protein